MVKEASFKLRYQDLVSMSHDKKNIYTVKTFDRQRGWLSTEGVILILTGIKAGTKQPFVVEEVVSFKEAFSRIKTIQVTSRDKYPKNGKVLADRRYPTLNLMTLGNGLYHRSKRSEKKIQQGERLTLEVKDLTYMGENPKIMYVLETFSHQNLVISEKGWIIDGELKDFNTVFPIIKTIFSYDEKGKKKIVAQRSYPNQRLVTLGNQLYRRPKEEIKHKKIM